MRLFASFLLISIPMLAFGGVEELPSVDKAQFNRTYCGRLLRVLRGEPDRAPPGTPSAPLADWLKNPITRRYGKSPEAQLIGTRIQAGHSFTLLPQDEVGMIAQVGMTKVPGEHGSPARLEIYLPVIQLYTGENAPGTVDMQGQSSGFDSRFAKFLSGFIQGVPRYLEGNPEVGSVEIVPAYVINPHLAKMLTKMGFRARKTGALLTDAEIETITARAEKERARQKPAMLVGWRDLWDSITFSLILDPKAPETPKAGEPPKPAEAKPPT